MVLCLFVPSYPAVKESARSQPNPFRPPATAALALQVVRSAGDALLQDLRGLCQDRDFQALLSSFSARKLVSRLRMYQARVEAVMNTAALLEPAAGGAGQSR
jgi:hypothetical protein